MPESYGAAAKVDLVGKVVPDISDPVDVPFRNTTDHPAEVIVGVGVGVTIDPTIFHFCEVRFASVC